MKSMLKFVETIQNNGTLSDFEYLHVFDTGIETLQSMVYDQGTERVCAQRIYASLFSDLDTSTTALSLFVELVGGKLLLIDQWISDDQNLFFDSTINQWKDLYKLSHVVVSPVEGDETSNYQQNHPVRRYIVKRCPEVSTSVAPKLHPNTARLEFETMRRNQDRKLCLSFLPSQRKLLEQLQRKLDHPLALSALQGIDSRPPSPFTVEYFGPVGVAPPSTDGGENFHLFEDYDELREEANQLRTLFGLEPY